MRKIDLIAILCLAAGGAVSFTGKPTARPSPALTPLVPGRFTLGSCQFAGLALGATQEEALSLLGEPTRTMSSYGSKGGNWIYPSEAGSLDLYWVDGRLRGIQCSVVMDENHAPSQAWLLAPGLGFGASTEQLATYFGPPAQVRKDKLETWNYVTPPGQESAELALGFEQGRLLHVRMSLK